MLWAVCATVGAVPFWLSPLNLTMAEAYFESMSGLTTTGATVLTGLDMMPRSILLWRSLLQWLGGIGIVAVALFLLPFLRVGGMQFFRTESSDRSDKALPRMAQVTRALCFIYVALTVTSMIVYATLGMSFFDAVNHAMTTLSTGGFSTHDRSFGFFESPRILWAAVIFMMLGSVPFVLYVELVVRGRLSLFHDVQVRVFVAGIIAVGLMLAVWLEMTRNIYFPDALTQSYFNVVSIVTTTGYASADYAVWGPFAFGLFFILTFIGGCSGSTTGGIKIYRFIIVSQALRRTFTRLVYSDAVVPLRFGGRHVDQDVYDSVIVFLIAYFLIFGVSILAMTLLGNDFITALTGALTALSNVGPGLGETIGPAGNCKPLGEAEMWVLSFLMLLGRLEIMTVLVLLIPAFWSD
jgi:trk system potassium uptake protein TrkH